MTELNDFALTAAVACATFYRRGWRLEEAWVAEDFDDLPLLMVVETSIEDRETEDKLLRLLTDELSFPVLARGQLDEETEARFSKHENRGLVWKKKVPTTA